MISRVFDNTPKPLKQSNVDSIVDAILVRKQPEFTGAFH
jgi:hypothetical protein